MEKLAYLRSSVLVSTFFGACVMTALLWISLGSYTKSSLLGIANDPKLSLHANYLGPSLVEVEGTKFNSAINVSPTQNPGNELVVTSNVIATARDGILPPLRANAGLATSNSDRLFQPLAGNVASSGLEVNSNLLSGVNGVETTISDHHSNAEGSRRRFYQGRELRSTVANGHRGAQALKDFYYSWLDSGNYFSDRPERTSRASKPSSLSWDKPRTAVFSMLQAGSSDTQEISGHYDVTRIDKSHAEGSADSQLSDEWNKKEYDNSSATNKEQQVGPIASENRTKLLEQEGNDKNRMILSKLYEKYEELAQGFINHASVSSDQNSSNQNESYSNSYSDLLPCNFIYEDYNAFQDTIRNAENLPSNEKKQALQRIREIKLLILLRALRAGGLDTFEKKISSLLLFAKYLNASAICAPQIVLGSQDEGIKFSRLAANLEAEFKAEETQKLEQCSVSPGEAITKDMTKVAESKTNPALSLGLDGFLISDNIFALGEILTGLLSYYKADKFFYANKKKGSISYYSWDELQRLDQKKRRKVLFSMCNSKSSKSKTAEERDAKLRCRDASLLVCNGLFSLLNSLEELEYKSLAVLKEENTDVSNAAVEDYRGHLFLTACPIVSNGLQRRPCKFNYDQFKDNEDRRIAWHWVLADGFPSIDMRLGVYLDSNAAYQSVLLNPWFSEIAKFNTLDFPWKRKIEHLFKKFYYPEDAKINDADRPGLMAEVFQKLKSIPRKRTAKVFTPYAVAYLLVRTPYFNGVNFHHAVGDLLRPFLQFPFKKSVVKFKASLRNHEIHFSPEDVSEIFLHSLIKPPGIYIKKQLTKRYEKRYGIRRKQGKLGLSKYVPSILKKIHKAAKRKFGKAEENIELLESSLSEEIKHSFTDTNVINFLAHTVPMMEMNRYSYTKLKGNLYHRSERPIMQQTDKMIRNWSEKGFSSRVKKLLHIGGSIPIEEFNENTIEGKTDADGLDNWHIEIFDEVYRSALSHFNGRFQNHDKCANPACNTVMAQLFKDSITAMQQAFNMPSKMTYSKEENIFEKYDKSFSRIGTPPISPTRSGMNFTPASMNERKEVHSISPHSFTNSLPVDTGSDDGVISLSKTSWASIGEINEREGGYAKIQGGSEFVEARRLDSNINISTGVNQMQSPEGASALQSEISNVKITDNDVFIEYNGVLEYYSSQEWRPLDLCKQEIFFYQGEIHGIEYLRAQVQAMPATDTFLIAFYEGSMNPRQSFPSEQSTQEDIVKELSNTGKDVPFTVGVLINKALKYQVFKLKPGKQSVFKMNSIPQIEEIPQSIEDLFRKGALKKINGNEGYVANLTPNKIGNGNTHGPLSGSSPRGSQLPGGRSNPKGGKHIEKSLNATELESKYKKGAFLRFMRKGHNKFASKTISIRKEGNRSNKSAMSGGTLAMEVESGLNVYGKKMIPSLLSAQHMLLPQKTNAVSGVSVAAGSQKKQNDKNIGSKENAVSSFASLFGRQHAPVRWRAAFDNAGDNGGSKNSGGTLPTLKESLKTKDELKNMWLSHLQKGEMELASVAIPPHRRYINFFLAKVTKKHLRKKNLGKRILRKGRRAARFVMRAGPIAPTKGIWYLVRVDMTRAFQVITAVHHAYQNAPKDAYGSVYEFGKAFQAYMQRLQESFDSPTRNYFNVKKNDFLPNIDRRYHLLKAKTRAEEFQNSMKALLLAHTWKIIYSVCSPNLFYGETMSKLDKDFSKDAWQKDLQNPLSVNSFRMILSGDPTMLYLNQILPTSMKNTLKSMSIGKSTYFSYAMLASGVANMASGNTGIGNMLAVQAPYMGNLVSTWQKKRQESKKKELLSVFTMAATGALFLAGTTELLTHAVQTSDYPIIDEAELVSYCEPCGLFCMCDDPVFLDDHGHGDIFLPSTENSPATVALIDMVKISVTSIVVPMAFSALIGFPLHNILISRIPFLERLFFGLNAQVGRLGKWLKKKGFTTWFKNAKNRDIAKKWRHKVMAIAEKLHLRKKKGSKTKPAGGELASVGLEDIEPKEAKATAEVAKSSMIVDSPVQ